VILGTAPANTQRLRGDRTVPADLEPWSRVFLADDFAGDEWPEELRTPERALAVHDADRAHWDRFGFGPWSVRERESDEYVGRVGLSYSRGADKPVVEIGWLIAAPARGQGYSAEIGREAVRVAFEILELDELIAFVAPDNAPSLAVAQALGFQGDEEVQHQGMPHLLLRLSNGA
jgi:RimJ/RimL family protein N-acetyltransferase